MSNLKTKPQPIYTTGLNRFEQRERANALAQLNLAQRTLDTLDDRAKQRLETLADPLVSKIYNALGESGRKTPQQLSEMTGETIPEVVRQLQILHQQKLVSAPYDKKKSAVDYWKAI